MNGRLKHEFVPPFIITTTVDFKPLTDNLIRTLILIHLLNETNQVALYYSSLELLKRMNSLSIHHCNRSLKRVNSYKYLILKRISYVIFGFSVRGA